MSSRPSLLLVLLVIMPLCLLAWLGTYLARDAVNRTRETNLVFQSAEFSSVNPQILQGVRANMAELARSAMVPVYLAVASGSLLVLALGWLFFRESHRAMRDARERVSFVNHVSHELKTPLTNIQLYAELATERAEGVEDDTAVRYLGIIGTETARLSRLINNVLNLARKQRDRLTIQLRESILDDVVRKALETWRSPLESRGMVLNLKLGAPEPMQIDSDAIEQILGNLISNVEKYALSGKYLGIFTETGAKGVRLTVEDRGAGVPVGMQETVFGAFERLRSDLTEGVSGTGIGLTISRELAHLHSGKLEVDAGYREGARFVLTLPKKSDENPGS